MKTIRQMLIAGAGLVLAAGVAIAQDGGGRAPDAPRGWGRGGDGRFGDEMQEPGMRPHRMRGPGMGRERMQDPIARLLDHQTLLRLTPAQVNSIISIDEKMHNDNKPLVERLMAMRMNGRRSDGRAGEGPDRTPPSDAQRDSAGTVMRTVRENVWRATAAADAVLTPDQLNVAGTLDRAAHAGPAMFRRPGGPGPDAGPGAPGGPRRGE